MGWTEEQALRTDVNAIVVAHDGRKAMLAAIFGGGEEEDTPPEPEKLPEMTPALFRAMFAR